MSYLRSGSVLVTGGSGFVGLNVVKRLAQAGASVIVLDRNAPPISVPWLQCDLADDRTLIAVRDAVLRADVVVHLAGTGQNSEPGQDAWRRNNVTATRNLMKLIGQEARIVFASSGSVYRGATIADDGMVRASSESDKLSPRGGYGASKLAAEDLVLSRESARGGSVCLRLFTVLGEHQRPDMVLARWVRALGDGSNLEVRGSLDRTMRDFTDIELVCDAMLAAIDSGTSGVINVGSGVPQSLRSLLSAVTKVVNREAALTFRPLLPFEPEVTRADVGKLKKELGVRPWQADLEALTCRYIAAEESLAFPRP